MRELPGIESNLPLAPLSTLGVGGPARYYLRAETRESVEAGVHWAREHDLPLFILGGGSNIVVADDGFPGLVLHVALRGFAILRNGHAQIEAAAGEVWDTLVDAAVERGWAGFECLSGIPGLAGAAPIQNVGAYGQDVSETIARVAVLELSSGQSLVLSKEDCGFGYRHSRFKREDRGRYVILGVTFSLRPGEPPTVRYPELQSHLALRGIREPKLADVRASVLEVRRRKSMVIDPLDPNSASVGSFFVNPVVLPAKAAEVREVVTRGPEASLADDMPVYPAPDGGVKLSAAWLIERAGFARGDRRGNVAISTNHTLALVNRGGGTAQEIVALAREIRQRVLDRFGIGLVPEPVFVNVIF
jgi:UDP-N-acetylmuramate dehydrogenase